MYIRKKTFILIITYLTAAVVALGAYTAVHFGMEGSYRRTAEYGYARRSYMPRRACRIRCTVRPMRLGRSCPGGCVQIYTAAALPPR